MVVKTIVCVLTLLGAPLVLASDPMMPPQWNTAPAAPAEKEPELNLQQIRIGNNDALAVINGRIVRVGDRVDGAQVVAIFPATVRVKIRQKERELSLLTNTRHFSE